MNEDVPAKPRAKASLTKTVALLLIAVVVVLLLIIAGSRLFGSDPAQPNSQSTGTNTTSVPADDVKADSGPNGDSTPSSNGADAANTLQNQ